MSRTRRVIIREALGAKYNPGAIQTNVTAVNKMSIACANDYMEKARSYTPGNPDIGVWRVGVDDLIRVGEAAIKPARKTVTFRMLANGSLVDQPFFIADREYYVHAIREVHSVACAVASTTVQVRKLRGTVAITAGDALLSTAFAVDATANTVQEGTLVTNDETLTLKENDVLAVDFTGTLTSLAGVVITIVLSPAFTSANARYVMSTTGAQADQCFYIATRPMKVVGAKCYYTVVGGSGAVVQITKDTSTDAPGVGTNLLTNTSGTGFDLTAAIKTVQEGALSVTPAELLLAAGDRLSVDFAGTLTGLAGLVIEVELDPVFDRLEITWDMLANGSLADQAFWIADRDYKILDMAQVHSVAGAGGAANAQITVDRATDAPGAGTNTMTNDTNAGFEVDATANTVQYATLVNARGILIQKGNRLAIDFAGTLTSLAGMVVTIALEPI